MSYVCLFHNFIYGAASAACGAWFHTRPIWKYTVTVISLIQFIHPVRQFV